MVRTTGRGILTIASIVILCVCITGCSLNDTVPRDRIISYVNKNYELLESFPYDEYAEIIYYDASREGYTDAAEMQNIKNKAIRAHLGNKRRTVGEYLYR